MKAHEPAPYAAWLAEQDRDSERLRPFGLDPVDDALEQRATDDDARDRALDHAPAGSLL